MCDSCDCSPKECLSANLFGNFFVPLQSGSEFTVSPAFSTVSRQVTQQHQQHFAMYDVKQISKLETLYFNSHFLASLDKIELLCFPQKRHLSMNKQGNFLLMNLYCCRCPDLSTVTNPVYTDTENGEHMYELRPKLMSLIKRCLY